MKWHVGTALLRRWYLAVPGLLLVVATAVGVSRTPGVYWTRYDVQLLPPPRLGQNSLAAGQADLSSAASLLAVDFNRERAPLAPVDPRLTLVDEGVRRGYAVRTLDYGGQWSASFRPMVNVQIVDSTAAAVRRREQAITSRLRQLLAQRQATDDIPHVARITSTVVPARPAVGYRSGAPARALASTLAAGGLMVALAVITVDRRLTRRRARQVTRAA